MPASLFIPRHRFDNLCELNQCEKIATLGDCYYCVSGCPNSVPDHAERIVEMGRSMCVAIQQFDDDHAEQVWSFTSSVIAANCTLRR